MIYIGCHLSVSDGYEAMGRKMSLLGGNTFAWFTRNPRGGRTRPANAGDIAALMAYTAKEGFGPIVAHASYTMNLCSASEETRRNGLDMLRADIAVMETLGGQLYNFHPGSHTGLGVEAGISLIAEALDEVITPETRTRVLLETMAGKGSEIGGRFTELKNIIDSASCGAKLGVCLDTCHVWDAGYDIVDDLDGVLTRFDKEVGLERIGAVHLNDSKNGLGSRKDRHEKLGHGAIGMEALKRIASHPALSGLPFILETPNDDNGYMEEIKTVKGWFM